MIIISCTESKFSIISEVAMDTFEKHSCFPLCFCMYNGISKTAAEQVYEIYARNVFLQSADSYSQKAEPWYSKKPAFRFVFCCPKLRNAISLFRPRWKSNTYRQGAGSIN